MNQCSSKQILEIISQTFTFYSKFSHCFLFVIRRFVFLLYGTLAMNVKNMVKIKEQNSYDKKTHRPVHATLDIQLPEYTCAAITIPT